MLTMTRLRAADDALVAYCPRCRTDVPEARTAPCEDEEQALRCAKCGDLLELAAVTVTDVPVDVDMAAICEDVGLPPDALTFRGMTCTHYHVVDAGEARVH